jgi:hypothetical protein
MSAAGQHVQNCSQLKTGHSQNHDRLLTMETGRYPADGTLGHLACPIILAVAALVTGRALGLPRWSLLFLRRSERPSDRPRANKNLYCSGAGTKGPVAY